MALDMHPELESERAYIENAYRRLDEIRSQLRATLREAYALERGGTPQSRAERDVIVRVTLERLDRLDFGDLALCFGRIDRLAEGDRPSEHFYIGRLAVAARDMEPLVVDWRAPIAEPFYRATGRDPMGLSLRRHFELHHGELVGIEDEAFDGSGRVDGGPVLAGPGALFYAIEQSRTGHMGDIVATIQAEQDEIIRAPLAGVTVVQGGPGTGKTAVALHRAAYLLYTYRNRLERQKVMVVAPSRSFAKYIDRVLPSLGETGVEITTIPALIDPSVTLREQGDGEARLKADRRMVSVIAKAVTDRERPLGRDVTFYLGSVQLTVTREMSRAAIRKARRRPGTHNERRRYLESVLVTQLAMGYLSLAERLREAHEPQEVAAELTRADFGEFADADADADDAVKEAGKAIRSLPEFQRALERIWPRLSPRQLLQDVYSHHALAVLAGRGVLTDAEIALLVESYRPGTFARSDLPLLDEAAVLLGPLRKKGESELQRFGHIVVDEAQEISYMEARVLGRRSISSSMTLVGDLAQTTSVHGQRDWERITAPMREAVEKWSYHKLTVNYRTPREISDLAYRLCDTDDLDLEPTVAIRSTGVYPMVAEVREQLVEALTSAAVNEAAAIEEGLVGVILPGGAPQEATERILAGCSGVPEGVRVEVLRIDDAKGLEFDSVIVGSPTRLLSEPQAAKAALFTAATRATRRLTLLFEARERSTMAAWGMLYPLGEAGSASA